MQPVRGTLPSDRRKSCPGLAGPEQPLGSRRSGGLRESELLLPRLQARCPPTPLRLPEQGPSHWPLRPFPFPGGIRSNDAIDRNFEDAWGLFCIHFKICMNPLPPRLCPMGDFDPLHSLESFSSARLDREWPSFFPLQLFLGFLYGPRDQTPEKRTKAACHPLLDPQTQSLWTV